MLISWVSYRCVHACMQMCTAEHMQRWEDIPWLPDQEVPHLTNLFLMYYWNMFTRGLTHSTTVSRRMEH